MALNGDTQLHSLSETQWGSHPTMNGDEGGAVTMEGELYIRLHRRKRRYCILHAQAIHVYNSKASFKENPEQPVLRIKVEGVGPWAGIHVVNPSRAPSETGFVIINGNPDWFSPRQVYVYADTAAERDQWLTALKKALKAVAERESVDNESNSSRGSWSRFSQDDEGDDKALTEQEFLAALYPAGEVYQNQAYGLTGWKSTNIRWHGRAKFSNGDGTLSTPWLQLEGWEINKSRFPCDKDGWQYATSFEAFKSSTGKETPITFIRRRLWERKEINEASNLWETEKVAERSSIIRMSMIRAQGEFAETPFSESESDTELEGSVLPKGTKRSNDESHDNLLSILSTEEDDLNSEATQRVYNSYLLEDTEQTVGYLVETIVRKYVAEMGVIRRRNVYTVLPQVVEPYLRQVVEFEGQQYGEGHKQQLEELVEEYSRKMKRRYSQGQNVEWVLRDILSKFIKSNIHKEGTIMKLRDLYSTTVSLYVDQQEGNKQKRILKVPKLRIVIVVVGSRGDVQPFIALGKGLADSGHQVRVATHEVFRDFVTNHGLDFFPLAGDPKMLMEAMVNHKLISVGMIVDHLRTKRPWMKALFKTVYQACITPPEGEASYRADALIANPPTLCTAHVAEKLGIPLHMAFTMPWTPTRAIQSPFITTELTSDASKYLSYLIVDTAIWSGIRDLIAEWRKKTLKLNKAKRGATVLNDKQVPYTYCFSEHLLPRPSDWQPWIGASGFWFLDNPDFNYKPPDDLLAFLEKGEQPIFIGFGSIVVKDPLKLTRLVIEAVVKSGERAIIQKGWSGLGDIDDCPEQVLMIGPAPHDWLFEKCKAVVHHGGAGTTAAGLRLGKPTVIVPFFGDQYFWGRAVKRIGAGPAAVPYSSLTADILADEIKYACSPQVLFLASEIGKAIQQENGVERAIQQFHAHLPLKFMVCQYIGCHSNRVAMVFYPSLGIRVCEHCDNSMVAEASETNETLTRYRFAYVDWSRDAPIRETGMVLRDKITGPIAEYLEAEEGAGRVDLMTPEVSSGDVSDGGGGVPKNGGVLDGLKDIVKAPFQRNSKGDGETVDLSSPEESPEPESKNALTGFVQRILGKSHSGSGPELLSTSSTEAPPSQDLEGLTGLQEQDTVSPEPITVTSQANTAITTPVSPDGVAGNRMSITALVQKIIRKKSDDESSSAAVSVEGGEDRLSATSPLSPTMKLETSSLPATTRDSLHSQGPRPRYDSESSRNSFFGRLLGKFSRSFSANSLGNRSARG